MCGFTGFVGAIENKEQVLENDEYHCTSWTRQCRDVFR